MINIFINFLAFITVFCSILAITSKNPVISIIYLISSFVVAAGYLILIGINFIGISYVVIYVGAIAILFLFIIMMINIKISDILETGPQYSQNLPLAIAIVSIFIFIIFTLIPFNFNNVPALSILLDKITYFNTLLLNKIFDISFVSLVLFLPFGLSPINFILTLYNCDTILKDFNQIEVLGHGLYTYDAILLITLSIILLLAMFAAIILSKSKYKSNFNSKN
jgi:NADH-ubiquinone oxidoreductase chain 6